MFLGEHPGRRWWTGSAVALAGTAVIAAAHGLGFGASALVVLAAAVLQGRCHPAQKPRLARYTSGEVTALHPATNLFAPALSLLVRLSWPAVTLLVAALMITRRDA